MIDNFILHIWAFIVENGSLTAFFLMLWMLMVKSLFISVYFSLLYFGMVSIKKRLCKKLSVRTNYYSWYLLFCSVVLANLNFNNGFMVLSHYPLSAPTLYMPYVYLIGCLLSIAWLSVIIFKLTVLMRINRRIKRSFRHMERYDDMDDLAERAASMLGLQKTPDIWVADYIETPVSYGIFKKVILLPVDYEEKYTPGELYLLLLHEMTHIKHGDTVKLFIISLVESFMWITPAMRLFTKSFKRDAELLCDNRVIGLMESERDTYGNLILKECAYKTARFGFGFSDSYQAIENRLDALYRYKADGHPKMLSVMSAAVLLICVLSYALRADWLIINDKYNSEFDIVLFDAKYVNSITLPPEVCAEVYVIEDGKIIVDIDALNALVYPYTDKGYSNVRISSDNYIAQTDMATLGSGYYNFHDTRELAGEQESRVAYSEQLNQRTRVEYLILLIASWL